MTYPEIVNALVGPTYPDNTLREIILFFRDLEEKLAALGPTWALARHQCVRELITFEAHARARGWELNTLRAPNV